MLDDKNVTPGLGESQPRHGHIKVATALHGRYLLLGDTHV
jgi:hypothetical protein